MTVGELIEQLKTYPPHADVYVFTGDVNLMEIEETEQTAPSMVVIS